MKTQGFEGLLLMVVVVVVLGIVVLGAGVVIDAQVKANPETVIGPQLVTVVDLEGIATTTFVPLLGCGWFELFGDSNVQSCQP